MSGLAKSRATPASAPTRAGGGVVTGWHGNGYKRTLKFKSVVIQKQRPGSFGFEKDSHYEEPLTAMLTRKSNNSGWLLSCVEVGVRWVSIDGRNWDEVKRNATAKLTERVHDLLQMYRRLFDELSSMRPQTRVIPT